MNLNPLRKSWLLATIFVLLFAQVFAQDVRSFGLFTGITSPYTFDRGINKDSRYTNKYGVKFAPIGIHYGKDFDSYGITVDPQISRIGQSFIIISTVGAHVGERNTNLTYLQIPVGFKLPMIDLSFLRVSFIGSIGAALLLNGEETITHRNSKLYFPADVYPNLPVGYTVAFDGVLVPDIREQVISKKSNFNSFQIFSAVGLRSDWSITKELQVSFDVRGNYGIFELRNADFKKTIKENRAIYDQDGSRRELFLSFNVGLSRTVEVSPRDKKKSSSPNQLKGKGKRKRGRN